MSDHTPRPYIIGQPGGPSGPFYSIVNQQGRVIAMQIPSEEDARAIVEGLNLLNAQSPSDSKAIIVEFYHRVCERAEANMVVTGTVSGAHWNAMIQELMARGIEVDR